MKTIDCIQLSPEWWEARKGIPTASNFHRIITPKTGKLAAAHTGYICKLIAEQYAPPAERFQNAAMRHGTETEAEARLWYAMEHDVKVTQVGFCLTDDGRFGCSPDGLVGEQGLTQIKCPTPEIHVSYLLDPNATDEHLPQMVGELIVTGRAWSDFVSYCPEFTLQPAFVRRITRPSNARPMQDILDQFHTNYQAALEKVKALNENTA